MSKLSLLIRRGCSSYESYLLTHAFHLRHMIWVVEKPLSNILIERTAPKLWDVLLDQAHPAKNIYSTFSPKNHLFSGKPGIPSIQFVSLQWHSHFHIFHVHLWREGFFTSRGIRRLRTSTIQPPEESSLDSRFATDEFSGSFGWN